MYITLCPYRGRHGQRPRHPESGWALQITNPFGNVANISYMSFYTEIVQKHYASLVCVWRLVKQSPASSSRQPSHCLVSGFTWGGPLVQSLCYPKRLMSPNSPSSHHPLSLTVSVPLFHWRSTVPRLGADRLTVSTAGAPWSFLGQLGEMGGDFWGDAGTNRLCLVLSWCVSTTNLAQGSAAVAPLVVH